MSRELLERINKYLHQRTNCGSTVAKKLHKELQSYVEIPDPEPVAWMSKTYPTTFATSKEVAQPAIFFTPLYVAPPDQSERIAELEKQLAALQSRRKPLTKSEIVTLIEQSQEELCQEDIDWGWITKKVPNEVKLIKLVEQFHGIGVEE